MIVTSESHTVASNGAPQTSGKSRDTVPALRRALNAALRGKSDVVEQVLACLLARGHLLIEDLPGLGKTTLAKALAIAVGGKFARVQCTPDLLPSDITGFNVFDQKTREFQFLEGPVFSHVLLADEINRATPRTQSALFEAMSERQVTTDSVSRRLPETFFVIATQNPAESHGVYPLPEAQLDRFAMKLRIGYPDRASELEMLAADAAVRARDEGLRQWPALAWLGLASALQLCLWRLTSDLPWWPGVGKSWSVFAASGAVAGLLIVLAGRLAGGTADKTENPSSPPADTSVSSLSVSRVG